MRSGQERTLQEGPSSARILFHKQGDRQCGGTKRCVAFPWTEFASPEAGEGPVFPSTVTSKSTDDCANGAHDTEEFVYTDLVSTIYLHVVLNGLQFNGAAVKSMSVLARALRWTATDVKSFEVW